MKVSDAIAKFLANNGIKYVFGYQGGSITHMIDSFVKAGIQYIQTYHEQGAGLAADAYARISDIGIGVAIGTNGPGATNLVTAIANAYCDSVAVLFFTGQVHLSTMKQCNRIRQESFQEIDIISIVKPITKYAVTIKNKYDVLPEIERAIRMAKEGRKGPVLIDLPVDIQGEMLEETAFTENNFCLNVDFHCLKNIDMDPKVICSIIGLLYLSERPMILCGGGVRQARAEKILREFACNMRIPVVCSLMGLDALNQHNDMFIGFIGSYGNRYANIALQNADLIFVFGSRLDLRQTGKRRDLFATRAKVIHVDIDETELGHYIDEEINVNADVGSFISELSRCITAQQKKIDTAKWISEINGYKKKYPDETEHEYQYMNPNKLLKEISVILPDNVIVCCDVGQNQMWAAQSLRISGDNVRILNSGGLGTMGYSLPATIGAYYADQESYIVGLMGDGGFQMNIQEMELIGDRQLPISIFIFNNHALGLIRDIHEKYYENRCCGSVEGFSMPDLEQLAKAYNFAYRKISALKDIEDLRKKEFRSKPEIIEVEFQENTYVKPELLGTDPLEKQIPYK